MHSSILVEAIIGNEKLFLCLVSIVTKIDETNTFRMSRAAFVLETVPSPHFSLLTFACGRRPCASAVARKDAH